MIDLHRNAAHRLRLGVVGCGKVFERLHLQAIQRCRKWQLVAACERLKSRRDWIRNLLPGIAIYRNFDPFLNEGSLDAVLIATPPESHYMLSTQALAAGHHVLVEKPMALDTVQALGMLNTARQAKKILLVGFNRRFRWPYRNMRDRLAKAPMEITGGISYRLILNPTGWHSVTPYLEDERQGGGILEDVVSHQADLLAWMFGTAIQKVRAKHLKEEDSKGIEIKMVFVNGFSATCVAGHAANYEEKMVIQAGSKTYVLHPTGILQFQGEPSKWVDFYCGFLLFFHSVYHRLSRTPTITLESMEFQWVAFADKIANPNVPTLNCDAFDGLMAVKVIEACRRSLEEGGVWQNVDAQTGRGNEK